MNRQAPHFYHLLEKFEAGIELTGTEVKSIREGKANLKDGYTMVKEGEVWFPDCYISPYPAGSYMNHPPLRARQPLSDKPTSRAQFRPADAGGLKVMGAGGL